MTHRIVMSGIDELQWSGWVVSTVAMLNNPFSSHSNASG